MKVSLRKRKLKNKTSLYIDIYDKGKRERINLGMYLTNDKASNKEIMLAAKKKRTFIEADLQNRAHGFVPDYKKQASFVKYFESKIPPNSKWTTWHSTFHHLKKFLRDDITFAKIDEKWLEDFKKYLLTTVSHNSASTYFQKVKSVLLKAKLEKIIVNNPGEYVKNVTLKDVKRDFLPEDDLKRLVSTKCKNNEVKRAFVFACFTGLRFSDIKNLKWRNVKNNQIEIKQQKTGDYNYIPLSTTAINILFGGEEKIKYLPEVSVFSLPQRWWYNKLLKDWFKEAKIDLNASSHVARHTYGTLNLTKGTDFYTVVKLLGHKNPKTTQIYAKIVDEKKKEAADRLPEIDLSN